MTVDWEKVNGLVPAIVQHAETGQVLMLGHMNAEALEETRKTGLVTFYDDSKQELWTKGEESGNVLRLTYQGEVPEILEDCGGEALLLRAFPEGPTCHLERASCFEEEEAPGVGFLGYLSTVIRSRAQAPAEESYTRRLLELGVERSAQKVGEEAVETVIAAVSGNREDVAEEAADLLYHLLVLLQSCSLDFRDVLAVLRRRHGMARSHEEDLLLDESDLRESDLVF